MEKERSISYRAQENKPLGVLVLHGFTSSIKTVDILHPYLKQEDISHIIPLLRGHGSNYRDLIGVKYQDWYNDALNSMQELLKYPGIERVIIVGLSMGGLVALELGMDFPELIDSVVTIAAAIKEVNPLALLTPILAKIFKFWPSPNSFNDPELAKECKNYKKFPTDSFASLHKNAKRIKKRLKDFNLPILILHSKKDSIISPKSAKIIYEKISSKEKEIKWFYKTNHEMLQDLEREEVAKTIIDFIKNRLLKYTNEEERIGN